MPPEERPRIGRLMRRRPRIQGCERPRAACCVSQVWRRGERLIDLFFFPVISGMETGMGEVNRCISSVISDRGAV
jgi:hypothetical protein